MRRKRISFGELQEFAQRGDRERQDQEAERPITRGVLDELDGIGAKVCG